MKTYMSWFSCCFVSTIAIAGLSEQGLQSYRLGDYAKAASAFGQDSALDPASKYALGRMSLYGYGVLKNKEEGLKWIQQAADQGDVDAQLMLAKMALHLTHDPVQALSWFKKAAEKNNLSAQRYCIAAYLYGFGAKKNEDSAERYAIMAAKAGDPFGQWILGQLFLKSKHTQNRKVGLAWIEKAANKHYAPAMTTLALLYRQGQQGLAKDEQKASVLLQEAMNQNDPKAMMAYAEGLQAAGESGLAQPWFEKAKAALPIVEDGTELAVATALSNYQFKTLAACGYGFYGILSNWSNPGAEQQYNPAPQMGHIPKTAVFNPQWKMMLPRELPIMELYTTYVQSQPQTTQTLDIPRLEFIRPKVTEHLIDKAILGDSQAQFALGQLYQQGASVEKNIKEAIRYYNKAAAQQDLRAEYNLGLIYLEGEDGQPDYSQALGWLTDAAFKGYVDAQYVLGQLLFQGYRNSAGEEVIAPDEDQAVSMFYLGAANGHPRSEFQLAEALSRHSMKALTVKEQKDQYALIHRLYAESSKKGIAAANVPLAFFDAATTKDLDAQARIFMIANEGAMQNNPLALLLMAILNERGIGTDVSLSDAKKYYEKAGKNPISLFALGTYASDPERLREAQAMGFSYAGLNHALLLKQEGQAFLSELLAAQASGNPQASLLLADYYLLSPEDTTHLSEAKAIYQTLATKGDPLGQLKLGYMLEKGLGQTTPDWAGAAYWYEQAGQQGQVVAQYRLGRLYQLGLPNQLPNIELAKKWYHAAQGQFSPSAVALGFLADAQEDQYEEAIKQYLVACSKKDAVAAYDLGVIYERGKGVPVSLEKAKMYYRQAADQGHEAAKARLALLK